MFTLTDLIEILPKHIKLPKEIYGKDERIWDLSINWSGKTPWVSYCTSNDKGEIHIDGSFNDNEELIDSLYELLL